MFESRYELLKCSKCNKILDKPFECSKCHLLFCSKCVYTCNNCKNKSMEVNLAIVKLLEKISFPCLECGLKFKSENEFLNHCVSNHKEKFKCNICSKHFINLIEFKEHIYYYHNHIVLAIFNEYSIFNNRYGENLKELINQNKINKCNESISDSKSINDKDDNKSLNDQEIFLDHDNIKDNISNYDKNIRLNTEINNRKEEINKDIINTEPSKFPEVNNLMKTIDLHSEYISRILNNDSINFDNQISKSVNEFSYSIDKFYRCNQKNLKCLCCPDNICREGNCFCSFCMKINKKNYNLSDQVLINKEERFCKLSNGHYYCGEDFIDDKISFYNHKGKFKCKYPRMCPACKDLNNNLSMYKN